MSRVENPAAGLSEAGNIDLGRRPRVRNPDGTVSTVLSGSYDFGDGVEVLIPHVSDDGRVLSSRQAIDQYMATGRHLGKYRTPADADRAAKAIHEQQERAVDSRSSVSNRASGRLARIREAIKKATAR